MQRHFGSCKKLPALPRILRLRAPSVADRAMIFNNVSVENSTAAFNRLTKKPEGACGPLRQTLKSDLFFIPPIPVPEAFVRF